MADHSTSTEEAAASAVALLSSHFRSHEKLTASLAEAKVAAVGTAWTIRVLRTAEAIVELHRLGLGETAAPMVRSVMEHAISMLWLVERREEAVKAIEYGHRRHQRLLLESAEKGRWDLPDLDPEMVDAPLDLAMVTPDDWPKLKNFEQRMSDPVVRGWYVAYRVESALSHASYLSGAVYVGEDGGFHWEPLVPPTSLRGTGVFALIAVQALNELLEPSPNLVTAVDDAAELLGVAS